MDHPAPGRTDATDHPAQPDWVIACQTCPSTNTWALDRLDQLTHGQVVWTERQTAGRGRGGSAWYAPPGVLTASVILDLGDDARAIPPTRLSLAAGLAICLALEDLSPGLGPMVKWPNDVILRDRKLAGLLCETRARRNQRMAVVIGIGLNLAPRWDLAPETLPLATGRAAPIGLDEVVEVVPAPLATLAAIRRYLLEAAGLLSAGGWDRLLPLLHARDWLRGRRVRIQTGSGPIEGTAAGIDASGALRIRDGQAGIHAIASGQVITAE